jgi:hypothetical protein
MDSTSVYVKSGGKDPILVVGGTGTEPLPDDLATVNDAFIGNRLRVRWIALNAELRGLDYRGAPHRSLIN